jgi:hypothetical protein
MIADNEDKKMKCEVSCKRKALSHGGSILLINANMEFGGKIWQIIL